MTTENTTLLTAGVRPGSRLAEIVAGRSDLMDLTQAAQEAILNPRVIGGISGAERVAFACRMARLSGEQMLAEYYEKRLRQTSAAAAVGQIADPSFAGAGDQRLAALIRHVDLVTQSPKNASRDHIAALRDAGIAEADIVRLAEMIAFINYQIRVVAGLRLLGEIV